MKAFLKKAALPAVGAMSAIAAVAISPQWWTVPKASVLERSAVTAPAKADAKADPAAAATWSAEGQAVQTPPAPQPQDEVALNSAPDAFIGFLEMHFDVSAKYRNGGDGTLCTEDAPCIDRTPSEVREAISKIYDGVTAQLGDRYDSETFYRVFFMGHEADYDPALHPGVKLEDVDGSVKYIVGKYLAETNGQR